jgi:diguanylate cyclase (GGDEF)-like protein
VPHFLISEPAEEALRALGAALDLADVGILLLNRDLRARFISDRLGALLDIPGEVLATGPTYREILNCGDAAERFSVDHDRLPHFLDEHEAAVQAGSFEPTQLYLKDGRRLLFSCRTCPDGGRILTYADISAELQREVNEALEAGCAEMRFQNETLESQAAYLASLAEATDEGARAVEAARLELEEKMAEQRRLEAELRRLANIDGLTGALNRVTFVASAQTLLEQDRPLTAMMLDVDHFKLINDQYGHAAGDHALRQLVAILQAEIRDKDLLGRLGGEEFAVVLPLRSVDEAGMIAERLRSRVAETPLAFGQHRFSMTISVGVAVRQPVDRKIDQVLAHADAALYQAKASGRNRVIIAEPAAAA